MNCYHCGTPMILSEGIYMTCPKCNAPTVATSVGPPDCCSDWPVQIEKVNGPIVLQNIRAGRDLYKETGGKPFRYCPWCGKKKL